MSNRRPEPNQGNEKDETPAALGLPSGDHVAEQADIGEAGKPLFVVPIEEAIDLHSFQPRDVLGVVDVYLGAALGLGFREGRLIRGRGKGVQRANVQPRLAKDQRVERYADAPPRTALAGVVTLVWLGSVAVPDDRSVDDVPDATSRD